MAAVSAQVGNVTSKDAAGPSAPSVGPSTPTSVHSSVAPVAPPAATTSQTPVLPRPTVLPLSGSASILDTTFNPVWSGAPPFPSLRHQRRDPSGKAGPYRGLSRAARSMDGGGGGCSMADGVGPTQWTSSNIAQSQLIQRRRMKLKLRQPPPPTSAKSWSPRFHKTSPASVPRLVYKIVGDLCHFSEPLVVLKQRMKQRL